MPVANKTRRSSFLIPPGKKGEEKVDPKKQMIDLRQDQFDQWWLDNWSKQPQMMEKQFGPGLQRHQDKADREQTDWELSKGRNPLPPSKPMEHTLRRTKWWRYV